MTSAKNSKTNHYSYKCMITNKLGLHARAAAKFVQLAFKFQSEITVIKDSISVNGKSIMGLLTLAAARGSELKISTKGKDAKQALDKLKALIESKFNEE